MNVKFYVFIFAVMISFFIAAPQKARGEEMLDTCLKMILPNEREKGIFNPDSVLVDSCSESPTYLQKFAKRIYEIELRYYEIDLPKMPADTIAYINIDNIDTTHHQLINDLRSIDTIFGNYKMWKAHPEYADSSAISKTYWIEFDNYQQIDTVIKFFWGLQSFYGYYCRYLPRYGFLPGDVGNMTMEYNDLGFLFPNPCFEKFFIKNNILIFKDLNIKILNELGIIVKDAFIPNIEYEPTIEINVSDLATGIYFCIIQNSGSIITKKFAIIR